MKELQKAAFNGGGEDLSTKLQKGRTAHPLELHRGYLLTENEKTKSRATGVGFGGN